MAHGDEHYVFLNLQSMDKDGDAAGFTVNRIPLKAETVSISTTKNVMAMPLPFSGIITGESSTLALDFGIAVKNVSISGILTEQTIKKKFDAGHFEGITLTDPAPVGKVLTLKMTADEISQLIHSHVDSSFMQKNQSITSLIVLIPSKVNKNYQYHSTVDEDDAVETLPRIPFTFKTRGAGDNIFDATPYQYENFPDIVDDENSESLGGFVRSFNTTHVPGQPFIEFSLEFEVAINPLG